MTYEQGREMAKHAEITQRVGWPFIFVTHTAPLNGSNENINGLIRQFFIQGAHSQRQLDEIAYLRNICPRKRFDWKCPIEMMIEVIGKDHTAPAYIQ